MPFDQANQRLRAASSFAAAVCVGAAIALAGCSSSYGVGQFLVDPSLYDVYHCKDLAAQWDLLNKREVELRANMDRASQSAGGKVVGVVAYSAGQQRIRDIAAFGSAHGLTALGSDWDMDDHGFALFRQGNRRYWRNVLRGQWNSTPATYCDYSYVTGDGKNQNTESFSNVLGALGMQLDGYGCAGRSAVE